MNEAIRTLKSACSSAMLLYRAQIGICMIGKRVGISCGPHESMIVAFNNIIFVFLSSFHSRRHFRNNFACARLPRSLTINLPRHEKVTTDKPPLTFAERGHSDGKLRSVLQPI